jgi:hypothetical protein
MKNVDFIIFLLFVGAFLLNYLSKRQKIKKPSAHQWPEVSRENTDDLLGQPPTSIERDPNSVQSKSTMNEWGSGELYRDAIQAQPPKHKVRNSSAKKLALSSNPLPASTVAKVAVRISPFAQHFRTKRAVQLAMIDRVVLGPCRANAPYGEHQ